MSLRENRSVAFWESVKEDVQKAYYAYQEQTNAVLEQIQRDHAFAFLWCEWLRTPWIPDTEPRTLYYDTFFGHLDDDIIEARWQLFLEYLHDHGFTIELDSQDVYTAYASIHSITSGNA